MKLINMMGQLITLLKECTKQDVMSCYVSCNVLQCFLKASYAVRNLCVLATHCLHNFYMLFSSISEL